MTLRRHLVVSFVAATSAFSFGFAHAADLGAAPAHVEQVYGRAGGLIGAERIAALGVHAAPVTVTYSDEVAARTNMATDRASGARIGITRDAEVVARTNMPRETTGGVFAETRPGRS
ncbi:MAG: hypothetical protein KIS79_10790 [Burkholderiales bacterium]|nr:hypothetical protein [Burkholderiales bacterium]